MQILPLHRTVGATPVVLLLVSLLVPVVGCGEEGAREAAPEAEEAPSLLTRVATSGPVPPTLTPRVELLDSTTACVIDSYRVAVVCDDRSWSSPARYGREGGGPYEYLDLSGLIAGPDGRLGLLDYRSRKLIEFASTGEPLREIPLPRRFRPLAPYSEGTILGVVGDLEIGEFSAPLARVDLESGAVLRKDTLTHESEATREHPYPSMNGALLRDSSVVVLVRDSLFAWYAKDVRFLQEFAIEGYGGRLPTEEEVEEYVETGRSVTGRPPPARYLKAFRERPVRVVASGAPMEVDHRGRLWVVTTVREGRSTLLAVFEVPDLASLVPVEGRARWLDIRGEVLVVLVERSQGSLPGWWLDWYRID